eukprot:504488-Prymnesium_polylepis.1
MRPLSVAASFIRRCCGTHGAESDQLFSELTRAGYGAAAATTAPPPLLKIKATAAEAEAWRLKEAVVKAALQAIVEKPCKPAHEDWAKKLLGGALEEPLRSRAIALLDAEHVVKMADDGCAMQPRQLLPPEAFISLEDIMAENAYEYGLRIICVSYPWLE